MTDRVADVSSRRILKGHMRVALLGAGFTRNWGGLLAVEVFGELCGRLRDDRELLRRLKKTPAFEDLLAELRQEAHRGMTESERFRRLEVAVLDTFDTMNSELMRVRDGLGDRPGDPRYWLSTFLARFDAIFTLNQDLFLEMHYNPGAALDEHRRWEGAVYPGVALPGDWNRWTKDQRRSALLNESSAAPTHRHQPIYKVHGSTNWRTVDGRPIVVIGGSKDATIKGSGVLSTCMTAFESALTAGGTKVMVVGYGFGDAHINDAIGAACAKSGMQVYLVNPSGLSVFETGNPMQPRKPVFENIEIGGVYLRPFLDAFRADMLAFNSFHRFLEIDPPAKAS